MWKRLATIAGTLVFLGLVAVGLMIWGAWQHPLALYEANGKRALESAGFEEQSLETPAGALHYWFAGSGPPLVFLHGAGDSATAWSRVAPSFTTRYTVYLPDLPGHGASAPKEGLLSLGTVYGGIENLVKRITPEERAIIVGNSLGAWLAMLEAHDHPDIVERIVLVNGGGIANEAHALTRTLATRDEARRFVKAIRDPGSPLIPNFVLDDMVRRSKVGPIARMSAELADMTAHLIDGQLAEISTPVDLLWGAADRLLDINYASRMQAALPVVRLRKIEACGHFPANECPQRFIRALEETLASPPGNSSP